MSDEKILGTEEILDLVAASTKTSTFQRALAQKLAVRGVQQRKLDALPHKIVFSATGKAGEQKVIEVRPDCYFRGESIDAKDTLDGAGTEIRMLLVGKKLQRLVHAADPVETREMMRAIRQGSFKFEMDTCQPALSICISVLFTKDCEFRAEISGKAIRY